MMKVVRSPISHDELFEIWRWNVERYNVKHANEYLKFLNESIDHLAANHRHCRTVPDRPDLRWATLRRKSTGHAHVAVFMVIDGTIRVLHIFHTAQDWQNRLKTDPE
jgi:plasmid stabilization system protein ParE